MAITRDAGATTFPISSSAGGFASSGVAMTSSVFTTNATSGLLVVCFGLVNQNGTNFGTISINGAGLTWTRKVYGNLNTAQTHNAVIYTAPFSSKITNGAVTMSWTTADASSFDRALLVDALIGATTGTVSGTFTTNGTTHAVSAPLTGVLAGSWSYVVGAEEGGNVAFTPISGTTEFSDIYSGAGVETLIGYSNYMTATFDIGWSSTMDWGSVAAYAIEEIPTPSGHGGHGLWLIQGTPGGRMGSMTVHWTPDGNKSFP